MEHSTSTLIDFQKDFEDHMRELASEISGLHEDYQFFTDDYKVLESLMNGTEREGQYT